MGFKSIFEFSQSWDDQRFDGDNSQRYVQDRNALALAAPLVIEDTDSETHAVFHERRTLASGGSYAYDLAGGIVDHFGVLRTFSKVKRIILLNLSTANSSILELGAGSNAFAAWLGASGDIVTVHPGGDFIIGSPLLGYTVTAGTADILTVTAGDVTQYDIAIIGVV